MLKPDLMPDQKMSQQTRSPAFFDKHFSEKLKLLYVKRLPSLVHDIAALVDKTITNCPDDFFSSTQSSEWASQDIIEFVTKRATRYMADEKDVAGFYERTTATFCVTVASTLALRNPLLLTWTQSKNTISFAIADGFLRFTNIPELAEKSVQLEEIMDEETLKLFRSLAGRKASHLTHEFKNMAAGGPETMHSIAKLSNESKFNWTECDNQDCARLSNHEIQRLNVQNVDFGPDAMDTPWTFDSDDTEHHSLEEMGGRKAMKRKRSDSNSSQSTASLLSPL